MPITKVIRSGVTPSVRKIPTSTTLTVLPMTADKTGEEVTSESDRPLSVESLNDAFAKFKPGVKFAEEIDGTDFKVDVDFRALKDFDPENLLTHQEMKDSAGNVKVNRNDLADLKNKIDVLYQVKTLWSRPTVERAWAKPGQRKEILDALNLLREEIARIPGGTK